MEATLVDVLEAALGSMKAFPDTAPAGVAPPYCLYQQVGGVPISTFCGGANRRNARIQIWIWALTRKEANGKMRAVEDALTGSALRAVALDALSASHDDVTGYYGARQDFSIWY